MVVGFVVFGIISNLGCDPNPSNKESFTSESSEMFIAALDLNVRESEKEQSVERARDAQREIFKFLNAKRSLMLRRCSKWGPRPCVGCAARSLLVP